MTLRWDDASDENIITSEDFLGRLGKDGVHVSMSWSEPYSRKGFGFVYGDGAVGRFAAEHC